MVKRNAERKNQAEYEISCGLVVSELDSTLLSNKGIKCFHEEPLPSTETLLSTKI